MVPLRPEVAALLGRLARSRGASPTTSLALESVRAVEEALHTVIPDEVLGVLAAEQRNPSDLVDFTGGIQAFYDAEDPALRRRLGFDHVAFAQLVGTPKDWTANPVFAAFRRTKERTSAVLVRWHLRSATVGGDPYTLQEYVERFAGATAGDAPPLELTLASAPSVVAWATHAKFGRGKVVARAEGKTTLEFDDGTVRVIGDRFLVFEATR